jgi:hypothetical protein
MFELNLRFSRAVPHLSMHNPCDRLSRRAGAKCRYWRARRDTGRTLTPVTAITDRISNLGETPVVNMVRRARKKAFFEPGDTRQQWKGEAAASFVLRDRQ